MKEKQKFSSKKLDWAKNRQSNLKKIDNNYDFSAKFSALVAEAKILKLQSHEDRCNTLWAELESEKMLMEAADNDVNAYFVDALNFVSGHFGSNSLELEKAGGTPTSKRKNPTKARMINKLGKDAKQAGV